MRGTNLHKYPGVQEHLPETARIAVAAHEFCEVPLQCPLQMTGTVTTAGLSPQPMIRRARPSVSLLRVYGGQPGVVLDHLQ